MNKNILLLFCINLFSAMGYSLISPLFPSIGERHNLNEAIIGWIISMYALTNFSITPFVPILVIKFGKKNIFIYAVLSEALCTIFYGFLNQIYNKFILISISFLFRALHGIGSGITATLVYSLTTSFSDENEVKTSLGYLEIAWSLGVASGPLLASILYSIGGYFLPFVMLGMVLLISIFFVYKLELPSADIDEEQTNNQLLNSLKNFEIIINLLVVVLGLLAITYYFPSLTNHLTKNYGLSVSVSSIFFIINMCSYFIILQYLDLITNRFGLIASVFLGIMFVVVGALLVYPIPIFPKSLIFVIIGLIFLGFSGAPIDVPIIIILNEKIKKKNKNLDDNLIHDISSALYNFSVNIGDFLGPIIGGFISEKKGFLMSNIVMGLIALIIGIIYGLFYFKEIVHGIMIGGDIYDEADKEKFLLNLEDGVNSNSNSSNYNSFVERSSYGRKRRHSSNLKINRILTPKRNSKNSIDL
jgi:MFS family permease